MKITSLALLFGVTLALGACGGSSSPGNNDVAPSTAGDTTAGDTTAGDTTAGDTTAGDTTAGGTTAGDTTAGDTTAGGTTAGGTTDGDGVTTAGDTGGITNAPTGLSHEPEAAPRGSAPPDSDPFISSIGRDKVLQLEENPAMVIEVVENQSADIPAGCGAIGAQWNACNIINLHIKDTVAALDGQDWKLYFHSLRRVLRVDSDEFNVFHVNGDLHYIEPDANYSGFGSEGVKSLKLVTEFSYLHQSDFMPRYWLVRSNQGAKLLASSDSDTQSSGYAIEISADNQRSFDTDPTEIANSSNRYARHADTALLTDVASLIIPTPKNLALTGAAVNIGNGFAFDSNVLSAETTAALRARLAQFHRGSGAALPVTTVVNAQLAADTYELVVSTDGASISGGSAEAVFHGAQSLLALVTPGVETIPQVSVTDSPRFAYRGMHADIARNFQTPATLKKLIDQMSAYKMNKLHLHLSDDEGWRLAITGLPELTTVGGKRQFQLDSEGRVSETESLMPALGSGPVNSNQGSGFLTRAQFVDLLQYAATRYVQVIPEFDMPAHARAAVVAMRARAARQNRPGDTSLRIDDPLDTSKYLTIQHYRDGILNPCIDGTYNFIQTVVSEVKAMFDEASMPLDTWHMGGDEANNIFKGAGFSVINSTRTDAPWEKSPACQSLLAGNSQLNTLQDLTTHFVTRVSEILNAANIEALYAWQDIMNDTPDTAIKTARKGISFWEIVSDDGYKTAYDWPARGFETVIASPDFMYFDFPYEADPQERGFYWGARILDTRKVFSFAPENLPQNAETSVNKEGYAYSAQSGAAPASFLGMQGELWSETVRTAEQFEYLVYPRLLAVAERAWHRADWERDYTPGTNYSQSTNLVDRNSLGADWNRFANALGQKELFKLDAAEVAYRVPTAGVNAGAATVNLNSPFPGLKLEYSSDGSNWNTYGGDAVPAGSAAFVRARSANDARAGRVTPVP